MKKVLFLLVLLCAIAQGTWAQEPYITDVIVIGDDDSGDADDKYHDYERAGWIGKVRDLNDGASGHYIYLMYKMNTSTGSSGTPITDFYLWVSATTPGPVSLTHMGRTYYRVGCDGDSQFRNSGGDLNCGAGGDYIHLYYAKEATSPVRINFIQFDNQPYNPCNCVGLNGSVVAADLNLGAGGDDIYMHVYKHLASSPAPIYTEGQLSDAVAITPGAPNLKLMNDINLSRNFVIGDIDHNRTASVTLDLNGYTLNRGLNSPIDLGSVIRVEPKSSLTINDSSDNPDTPEYDGTGTITGGYTNQDGGGIVNHGTLTINGANIKGNTARGNGGGIFTGKLSGDYYGVYDTENWPEVHINGVVIENCSSDGNGGGFCQGILDGTRLNKSDIKNCIIRNNVSKKLGGGIYNDCLLLEVTNCTVSGNNAFDTGGVYNGWGGLSLNGCTVTGNKGTDGAGGIANETDAAAMEIANCTVTDNFAGTRGGGVWNGNSAILNVVGSRISGNTAASTGGGIYNNATLKMKGNTVVSGNSGDNGENPTSNLYLDADSKIEVTGAFTDGAHIGVNPAYKTATITSGYGTHNGTTDPNTIFSSDFDPSSFSLNDNGEVVLTLPTGDWTDYRANDFSHKEGSTIYIENEAELALVVYNVSNGNNYVSTTFVLNTDLDMSAHEWTPIGTDFNHPFKGNFDGNGHTISGVYVNSTGSHNGLFGYVEGTITLYYTLPGCNFIKDFVLKNSYIKGGDRTGGVVGYIRNSMTLENVVCQADVTGGANVGGIVGDVLGDEDYVYIKNCLFLSGKITSTGISAAVIGNIGDWVSCSNNYYADPASYVGNSYDVRAYPIIESLPEGVTLSYSSGVYYNSKLYHPGGTVNFTMKYDINQFVSVEVNGDELVSSEGNYSFTFDPATTEAYEIKVTAGTYSVNGSGTEAEPYRIASQEDWNHFVSYLNNGAASNDFSGAHFKLTADNNITVNQRMGNASHPFCGIFDGDGKTLTLAFGDSEDYLNQECAPFYSLKNATIKNLVVSGNIYSSAQHNAGIAVTATGNNYIQNCVSNVSIHSNRSGDCTNGGFISLLNTNKVHVYFDGCAFTGELLGANTSNWGGFVGWREYGGWTTCFAHFKDCLFAPTNVSIATPDGSNSRTFCRYSNSAGVYYTKCYYTEPLQGADGGKQAYGTTTAPANIGAEGTEYNVSGITTYGNGLLYGGRYYTDCIGFYDNASNTDLVNDLGTTYEGKQVNVTLTGRTLYRDGDWNTLCLPFDVTLAGSPLKGAEARTLSSASFNAGTLTLNFGEPVTTLNAGTPYIIKWNKTDLADLTISSKDDWDAFADAVNNGNNYSGKTVLLTNDIDVETMVGTNGNRFKGTFDGNGHKLTFTATTSNQYCAPFRYVENATIMNLHTTGTITTSKKFGTGLVGYTKGTTVINNCWSSVDIISSVSGDGSHGGFVGYTENGASNTTLTNCLFDGSITGENTNSCGGLIGWNYDKASLTNCVFRPTSITLANSDNATFSRGSNVTVENCYYSENLPGSSGQGTAIGDMTDDELLAALGSGWKMSGSKVVPDMTKNFADIVNPVFNSVIIDAADPISITPGLTAGTDGDACVTFQGIYDPVTIGEEGDNTKLYFSTGNTLYWPNGAMTINPFRAYLQLNGATAQTRSIVLNIGDETTEIEVKGVKEVREVLGEPSDQGRANDDSWYSLDGRRLDGKPTAKGIYIHGGKKVMIK